MDICRHSIRRRRRLRLLLWGWGFPFTQACRRADVVEQCRKGFTEEIARATENQAVDVLRG